VLLRTLNVVGRILLILGVLLLLFTAYQLWGTGITESHSQSVLRSQLARELPPGAAAKAHRIASAAQGKTRTGSAAPSVAPTVAAPAEGQPIGTIQIPSIGLDQVVVEGTQTADLRMGPGHYPGTPLPGEAGNASIAGHRTTYGHPFYDLNAVDPGDQIVITTPQGIFVYTAQAQTVVSPTDVSVVGPSNTPELTLTTCNPRYSASTRLVLKAALTRSLLFSSTSHHPTTTTTPSGQHHPAGAATGLAGGGGSNDWLPALLWGLATAVVATGVWLLARRVRHRWAVYLVGTVAVLVVLFFFFAAVSPLLPASF
jgi:sortase A